MCATHDTCKIQDNIMFDACALSLWDCSGTQWFAERGIPYLEPINDITSVSSAEKQEPVDDMETLPGCAPMATDIAVGNMYATQDIRKGDIVEVSRALVIPLSEAQDTELYRFAWHSPRQTASENAAVLLLLGNGALYPPVVPGGESTLTYKLYQADQPAGQAENHTCSETVLIAFVARRDIHVNQQLTVPLSIDGERRIFRSDLLQSECF